MLVQKKKINKASLLQQSTSDQIKAVAEIAELPEQDYGNNNILQFFDIYMRNEKPTLQTNLQEKNKKSNFYDYTKAEIEGSPTNWSRVTQLHFFASSCVTRLQ